MEILGIDIGGTGIKGAPVDIERGIFMDERYRIPTPQPSAPEAVAEVVARISEHFGWTGPVGCTFPAVVKSGVVYTAANVDDAWVGKDAHAIFKRVTGLPVLMLNDADAAGIAEMAFGAGRGRSGVVFVLTLGTGIGSAIFVNGMLMPNTELGHMEIRGKDAEHRAANSIRKQKALSWKKWAARVNEYLHRLEFLFSPDLFIIGGGVSKRHDKFLPLLNVRAEVVPAQLFNDAGIVGAAMAAASLVENQLR
jgi:polyphosphate glucokinase